MLSQKLQQAHL